MPTNDIWNLGLPSRMVNVAHHRVFCFDVHSAMGDQSWLILQLLRHGHGTHEYEIYTSSGTLTFPTAISMMRLGKAILGASRGKIVTAG